MYVIKEHISPRSIKYTVLQSWKKFGISDVNKLVLYYRPHKSINSISRLQLHYRCKSACRLAPVDYTHVQASNIPRTLLHAPEVKW